MRHLRVYFAALALGGTALSSGTVAQEKAPTEQIARLRLENIEAFNTGNYQVAERVSARLVALVQETSGDRSSEYINALALHAISLSALGRSEEAEPLHRRVVVLSTDLLGDKHPDTIARLTSLAGNLETIGRSAEAEPLFRRALALSTQTRGDKHPETITSLDNLAGNLDSLGRPADAEPLYRRALTLRAEFLGEQHTDTITSMNNLAVNLDGLGRSAEAEPLFRRALALSTELRGEKHPGTITIANTLAGSLNALGRSVEAEPIYRRALELRVEVLGEKHDSTITTMNNLAINLGQLGRSAEAEPLFRRALALSAEVLGENHPGTITSLNNLANNLNTLGRSAEAEPLFRRSLALSIETQGEKHPNTISSINNLAYNLDDLSRSTEAEPLYRRALEISAEVLGEKHPRTINRVNNLAANLDRLGRSAEAEPLYRRALTLRLEVLGEKHPSTVTSMSNLAGNLDSLGRSAEAEALIRRALTLSAEVRGETHPLTIVTLSNLSHFLLSKPTRAFEAEPFARRGTTFIRQRLKEGGTSERDSAQRERDVRATREYMTELADADWAAARVYPARMSALRAESFKALQDATGGSVTQAVALTAARRAAEQAGSAIGAVARERQSLAEQWRANDAAQSAALAAGSGGAASLPALRTEQVRLEAAIRAADLRLEKDAPAYFSLIRPTALPVADMQRLLGADEAALLIVPTEFGTHIMAATREGLVWTRSAMKAEEIAAAVATLRRNLDPSDDAPAHASYDRATAYALYRATIEPVSSALAGKAHVFIAADGELASLPFGALVASPPEGSDTDAEALRKTDWLGDRFALVQLPSLQSLAFIRRFGSSDDRAPTSVQEAFSGFGDPAFSGKTKPTDVATLLGAGTTQTRGGVADRAKLADLAPLPGTSDELDALRRVLGAPPQSVRTGANATEAAVRAADLSHTRVIAFATHGLTAGEGGLAEPGLVFTPPAVVNAETGDDGLLTASEVTALKLDADWVILSACNTAAGAGGGEPGLSGLARAFFYAGARSILASHWRVRDDVAPMLIVEAVRLQRNDPKLSRAQALQKATRAVRNDVSDPSLAHPRAWAPFSLIGDRG